MTWRVVKASIAGTSHALNASPCQDAHCTKIFRFSPKAEYLVAVISDGAGSAEFGGTGAAFACERITKAIGLALRQRKPTNRLNRNVLVKAVSAARARLSSTAETNDRTLRDYACTLVGTVIGQNDAWFFQCGDGAIVARKQGPQGVVFWPDSGEYANMTYFITDAEWRHNLRIEHADGKFSEVALLTDGLQRLALSFNNQTVFEPFFEPMFSRLRKSTEDDCEALNKQLGSFLDSASINDRTDDDKTLVLAVR